MIVRPLNEEIDGLWSGPEGTLWLRYFIVMRFAFSTFGSSRIPL